MNQPPAQPRCSSCGASLSLDDLRGANCRYCGTALPHHARAAEQAALVNQMLNQQFQARGLVPPGNPVVPYQYGAPPSLPLAPPGRMSPATADAIAAASRTSAVVIVTTAVIVVFVMMASGVAFWILAR